MLLPREHLQLSLLDLTSPYGSFESSRYYESSIKILDLEGRIGSRPVVLIARLETDNTLYVLERQKNALYTLCHLGSWTDLQELQVLATVSCPQFIQERSNTSAELSTPISLTTPQLHHDNKKRRLAIEAIQSLVKKPARARSLSTLSQPISPTELSTPAQDNAESQASNGGNSQDITPTGALDTQNESQMSKVPEPDDMLATPTADTIFDNIRNQYLESLYHSMVNNSTICNIFN